VGKESRPASKKLEGEGEDPVGEHLVGTREGALSIV